MTKNEMLEKIKNKPKNSQILIRYNHSGDASDIQTVVYLSHDRTTFNGVLPLSSVTRRENWNQAEFITEMSYFKPDKLTQAHLMRYNVVPEYDSKEKHVGIELEFVSQLDHFAIETLLAQEKLLGSVTVKEDSSIKSTPVCSYTHEICILAKEKEMARVVKKVCKILSGNSAVNKTCGLHVHLDMRHRDYNAAYANLYAAQPLLYAMCPKIRMTNDYCKPIHTYAKMSENLADDGRYFGVNKSAYNTHKTIEIRMHSGTINAFKIINWVRILVKIADKAMPTIEIKLWNNYKTIKKELMLNGMLEKYVLSRIEEFKDEHEDSFCKLIA